MAEYLQEKINLISPELGSESSDVPGPESQKEASKIAAESKKKTPSELLQQRDEREHARNVRRFDWFEDQLNQKELHLDQVVTSREKLHADIRDKEELIRSLSDQCSRLVERVAWESGATAVVALLSGAGAVGMGVGGKSGESIDLVYFFGGAGLLASSVVISAIGASRGFFAK